MAIKVLKVGENVQRTRDVTCSKCHSELQYSKADVQFQSAGFKMESETYYYIACPLCNHRIHIDHPADM